MTDGHIAIVGMAARAPHAQTVDELWERVAGGANCIDAFADNADQPSEIDELLLRHGLHVKAGGVLDAAAAFDADYFGFNRLDADLLDPQQRVFLEVAQHALNNAAAPPSHKAATGVFAGCAMSSYLQYNLLPNAELLERVGAYPITIGNDKDYLATRVSYKLGLGGPSISVQTACSTSLVAVHVAAQSLLAGECDTALAGGVSIRFPQRRGYLYQPDGILSSDGCCRPFDARADGFVPGNGAAVVVLRRLHDALADGDPVRGVLRASAVNNDGAARMSYTSPSVEGQIRVLSEALALSGLEAGEVTHIEAHGTATALGDAVEFAAIERVYGSSDVPCLLGAVKANVGHLDTAAGALSLIKVILSLEHEAVPPVANFQRPNPSLRMVGTRFRVPTTLTPWPGGGPPRRAAVTSLGLGGTNAHVILEAAPTVRRALGPARRARILPVTARDREALAARVDSLRSVLAEADDAAIADQAYSLATCDKHELRVAVVSPPSGSAAADLFGAAVAARAVKPTDNVRVAFVFPGGGAQHPAMARDLAQAEPAFAEELARAVALVAPLTGSDVAAVALGRVADAEQVLRRPSAGLPALFCVQLALARVLGRWGVRPQAVMGHSAGEYVAACIAGVLDERDAARLVVARATLLEQTPSGAMLSVDLDEQTVAARIGGRSELEISAVNGPRDVVVGGVVAAVDVFERELSAEGVRCRRVAIDVAAHTSLVASVAEHLAVLASGIRQSAPRVPCVSNLTGTWLRPEDVSARYWADHLRRPVRFGDGLATLLAEPGTLIVDMGPGQTIGALLEHAGAAAVPALPHRHSSTLAQSVLAAAVGRLWSHGVPIDWEALYEGEERRRVPIPPYPFRRTRHWIEPLAEHRSAPPRRAARILYGSVLQVVDHGAPSAPPDGTWLLFTDGSPLGSAVRRTLSEARVRVVMVSAAPAAGWAGDDTYHLPVTDDAAVAMLFEEIGATSPLAGVVQIWDASTPRQPDEVTLPYHATAALVRAVGRTPTHAPLRLVVATRNLRSADAGRLGGAEVALAAGLVRTIGHEFPELLCRCVTLDPEQAVDDAARELVTELAAAEPEVILRGGARYVERFRRVPPPDTPARLNEGGVWLVVGGLGAIGRTLAVHLATQTRARLVLVARRPLPPHAEWDTATGEDAQRVAAVRAIVAAGVAYEMVVGDIADPAVACRAVELARARFGAVHGVVHAAGVPAGGLIQLRDPETSEAVLRPKVAGMRALDAAFGDDGPDIVVLCSALDALLGTAGQAEHCAANAYLDALVGSNACGARRIVSIAWTAWRDIGQAARAEVPAQLRAWRADMLSRALTAEEGCEVFEYALAGAGPRLVVSVTDVEELRRLSDAGMTDLNMAAGPDRGDAMRVPRAVGTAPRTPTEARIAQLWSGMLNAPEVGPDDDFFALGGHSLAAMQLVSQMRETFSVAVTLRDLLARPTVAAQAELIEDLLIDEIEQLSDTDVEQMLGELDER